MKNWDQSLNSAYWSKQQPSQSWFALWKHNGMGPVWGFNKLGMITNFAYFSVNHQLLENNHLKELRNECLFRVVGRINSNEQIWMPPVSLLWTRIWKKILITHGEQPLTNITLTQETWAWNSILFAQKRSGVGLLPRSSMTLQITADGILFLTTTKLFLN